MKNILVRQIIFIPILYVAAKLLWDLIPVEFLPDLIEGVISDLFGPMIIMVLVLFAFIYFFWKIPVLGKLTQFLFGTKPFIQGTWKGRLKYEWEGKKLEKTSFLVIKQINGYSMDIWLLTDERKSSSCFADIIIHRGIHRVLYTYSTEESPVNKEKNPSHEGFCSLDIINSTKKLQGIYYTCRKTFGELIFDNRNKYLVIDFVEAQKLFGLQKVL